MSSSPQRVLIIDDNEDILYTFSAITEHAGWSGKTALDGFKGLDLVVQWKPHLIIVDYHMPEMNGEEFLVKLREFDSNTPVMVLTVDEDQALADRLLNLGATDFALKPLRAPDLIARVNLHLRPKPTRQERLEAPKGISQTTLDLVVGCLVGKQGFLTVDELAKQCGLSYQSVYRYVAYLERQGRVEITDEYGEVGRPKRRYRWRTVE